MCAIAERASIPKYLLTNQAERPIRSRPNTPKIASFRFIIALDTGSLARVPDRHCCEQAITLTILRKRSMSDMAMYR